MLATQFQVKPGDVVAQKYQVERVLGSGGMGMVVAARHLDLNELVALKFLLPEMAEVDEQRARFLREARAAIRIKSQHVAHVLDVGRLEGDKLFIVMEYLEGDDLSAVLSQRGTLPTAEAVDYILQACDAVSEAHALGIVHRDLKPGNLFLCRRADGSALIKVMDFGISKLGTGFDTSAQEPAITRTGGMIGSPAYMSPEQVRDAKQADARSDVWSLGIILYEATSGRYPFAAETLGGLLGAILSDPPIPLDQAWPEAPADLANVVMRCLAKDPADRFQTVADLASALRAVPCSTAHAVIRGPVPAPLRDADTVAAVARELAPTISAASQRTEAAGDTQVDTEPPLATPQRRRPYVVGAIIGVVVLCAGAAVVFASRQNAQATIPVANGAHASAVASQTTAASAQPSEDPAAVASIASAAPSQGLPAASVAASAAPSRSAPRGVPAVASSRKSGTGELGDLIDERR
ncbi:MAG: serine/threonine protein kinase [Deltaproteobacteria bacterium]|nr:serine/threonine protein kinase [Deltaproteobacteria bacterium]